MKLGGGGLVVAVAGGAERYRRGAALEVAVTVTADVSYRRQQPKVWVVTNVEKRWWMWRKRKELRGGGWVGVVRFCWIWVDWG